MITSWKTFAQNFRTTLLCFTLLGLATQSAWARGAYLRTKDGKARVWNNAPDAGDAATWSGDADADGYATGPGTLTWFTATSFSVTGTNIPSTRRAKLSRYTGKMVHGKLQGKVVGVDADGTTYHGTFVDGRKTADWTAGDAPVAEAKSSKRVRKEIAVKLPPAAPPLSTATASPAEASTPEPIVEKPAKEATRHSDDSLQSLAMPPPSLRANIAPSALPEKSEPPAKSSPRPRLKMEEVIQLADGEARSKGYSLSQFERIQAIYTAPDDRWSVSYDQKSADAGSEPGNHFSISVEDKTKKASLIPGK